MKLNPEVQTHLKKEVAKKAASLVKPGMLVGLGTGTTATFFIEELCKRKLNIKAASSSKRSEEQARKGGIEVVSMDKVTELDFTVDSADEVNPRGDMIKGGGGALTREKIVIASSREVVIIVDESKCVETLGAFGLPVELLPFGLASTLARLEKLGYQGVLREGFVTDNGNVIVDLKTPPTYEDPKKHHQILVSQAGVVETGLFFEVNAKVLIAYETGEIAWMNA